MLQRPDGTRVAVELSGREVDPLLVLVHGFAMTLRLWDVTIPALHEAGWRTATFDLRGHGQTEVPDDAPCDIDAVVGDVLALADHANAESFVVGGLSMGGFVALCTVVAAPDRVRGLVLADTGPGFGRDEARAAWNAAAEDRALDLEERGEPALAEMAGSGDPTAALGVDRHRSPGQVARAARALLVQHDRRGVDALASITVPTLVMVGADDAPFLGVAEVLEARIPGATRAVIPDAGHQANVDNPDAFNAALVAFLQQL